MDGLASLMQQAPQGQPQQAPQAPMPGMNPRLDNAVEVVNNDIENLNLDPRTEYALKVQEASDLLASAERDLAMKQPQPTPPEVVDQRKQQVQQRIQQGVAGLLQQLMPGMQQRGMQMAAMQNPRPPMQAGLPTQAAPNMARMMDGGIVGYQEGGEIYDDIGAMAALYKQASDKLYDPAATPEEKANAQRQIDMINAQAGSRIGQVRRRVAEMSGTMDMEMAGGGYVKRYQAGELVRSDVGAEDYLRAAIRQEDVTDPEFIAFLEALYAQESSSGTNVQDSPSGAKGPLQIRPGTFYEVADEDWDINDPMAQTRGGIRYAKKAWDAAERDARLAGAHYYGGRGGMNALIAGEDRTDPLNDNFPSVSKFGDDIVRIMEEQANLRNAQASVADVPPALNNAGQDFGQAGLAGLADTITQQEVTPAKEPGFFESRQNMLAMPEGGTAALSGIANVLGKAGNVVGNVLPHQQIANTISSAVNDGGYTNYAAFADVKENFPIRPDESASAYYGRLTREGVKETVANSVAFGRNVVDNLGNAVSPVTDFLGGLFGMGGAETPAEVPDVAEAPNVADEFRFYDVVGDALTPNAELLTGDTTEPAAKDVVDVVDELDAARREGREINWDSLISGLLAAGQGTSTATALGGFGMGSQAERRRQEALAIEQEQAQLERDLRREILGEESTIAREQMQTQIDVANTRLIADLNELARRTSSAVRQDIIQNIRANADMNFLDEVDALVEQELRAIEDDSETRDQYEALTGLSSRTWFGLTGPSEEFKELVRRTVERRHLNTYLDKEEARITGAQSGVSGGVGGVEAEADAILAGQR
jgi:hypothetical protein